MKKIVRYADLLFGTLSEITSLIVAGHDKRLIFQKLLVCSLTVLDAERVYLLEIDHDRIIRYTLHGDPEDAGVQVDVIDDSPVLREWMMRETRQGRLVRRGGELGVDMSALSSHCLDDGEDTPRVIISAPLAAKRSMFGLLIAIHRDDGGVYAEEDERLITILADHAAIAVENALLYQKLEMEAITDGLTGVFNYRFLVSALETEIKRARRFRQAFSFVMLDVDNLKAYNDRLGHLHGSQALCDIAGVLRANCREIDLVSKYGGDEFGILLPQTGLEGARKVTERVVRAVAAHRFDGRRAGLLTCSAGVSSFPRDGQTVRDLIAAADRALYRAKRSGRNRVLTTDDLLAATP